MARPAVAADTETLYDFLPQFVQDTDEANGWPFLSWLNGAGSVLQNVDTLVRDQPPAPGWSLVLDVTRAPTSALPWLAQFVGVRFTSSQTTDAQQRAAITAEQGFGRGTVAAIIAAANPLLSSGTAVVIERTPNPGSILVQIPAAGLAAGTYGQLEEQFIGSDREGTYEALELAFATYGAISQQVSDIIDAILNAVPAGIFVTIVTV